MRPLPLMLLYLAGAMLAGAGVAPWLYWAVQWGAEPVAGLESLARQPYHRYVHRAMLLMALAGLWPFLRALRANSWLAVGLPRPTGQGRRLLGGFGVGFASLAVVALLAVGTGARTLDSDLAVGTVFARLASAAGTAALVGLLEELLFRGVLFGALRRAHHWVTALLVSSAVYSIVHFFERPPSPEQVTWTSGLLVLAQMLRGFGEVERLVPGFFSLLLAGVILGIAFHRTGTLYFSIGLHAGWIFWLKFYQTVTTAVPGVNTAWWGTGRLVDGWVALGLLGVVWLVVWRALPPRETKADGP